MKKDSFYITTTIPYVNADPHIGFALELVQADAIARYQRLLGKDVFFSTGTDEYGQKIWEASKKEGKNVQDYVDHFVQRFLDLRAVLGLSYDNFIRTTSQVNIDAAQEFWSLLEKKGDIYKSKYTGLYCVGCETFYPEKNLVDGKCPIHLTKPEAVEEENYFFKLSNYKKQILEYLTKEKVIFPEWRRLEAIDFVNNGMEDFSISRSKERVSWGIPIKGDDTQVMYVWFGAFVNYISTLGWPNQKDSFEKFWMQGKKVQLAGKDMVKFQSVMWQGMLLSAGMATTDTVLYHGFVTGEGGIKMSKSLGNVINPNDIVKEYGTDAMRYFLLREVSTFEDNPFTMERFKESYNANLANGLGNLVSRVLTMSSANEINYPHLEFFDRSYENVKWLYLENFDIKNEMDAIWKKISEADKFIQTEEPFKLIKTNPIEAKIKIQSLLHSLVDITIHLKPFLPNTAYLIERLIKENKKPEKPLFPRKD